MSAGDDLIKYDDDEAVKFILNQLPQEMKENIDSDQINYVIDIVYEFYDEKGFITESEEDSMVEVSEDDIIEYVLKITKKDKIFNLSEEDITFIVQGELAYCDSIGLFE